MQRHSAGIVFFSDNIILLGRQKGTWSSFGGRCNEGETPVDTAVRECYEELRGVMAKEEIMKLAEGKTPIESSTPRGDTFYLFCIFSGIDLLKHVESMFRSANPELLPKCMQEMDEVAIFNMKNLHKLNLRSSFRTELKRIRTVCEKRNSVKIPTRKAFRFPAVVQT